MKIRVAKGKEGDREGSLAGLLTIWLKWPGGLWHDSVGRRPSATMAALQHRLAGLGPDERREATIRATTKIWAKAGGRRQRTLATWRREERETLGAFLVRARAAYAKLQWRATPKGEDAWIDESDL
jgi:hypothetical protein